MTAGQLELRPSWDVLWDDDRRLIRRMAEAIEGGLKYVAAELDVAPSQLAHGLDERFDRNLPARWVRWIVAHTTKELREQYVRSLVAMIGWEMVEAPPLTPKEELVALKETLAECLGPELRQAVLDKAKRRRR